ncbi:MAG: thiamine-phosphate kinase [Zetaproteobacteria bacterium]|nr:thiamine-phosphate kinase [Zetaproteobacteria bacterium]
MHVNNNEFELIELAFRQHVPHISANTSVTNGDDASVHRIPEGFEWVTSVDVSLAGVHWPDDFPLALAADRAVCAALSDLAAMGATATNVWVAAMATDASALNALGQGVADACNRHGVELSGGDTVKSSNNGLSVTVAGLIPNGDAMRRNQARVGESLWVVGLLGMSALSLEQWQLGQREAEQIRYFARIEPLLSQGVMLRQLGVRSCIDISDGLLQDAHHLAKASGCGLQISLESLPFWQSLSTALGHEKATKVLLSGGEDYALLFSAPTDLPGLEPLQAVKIGTVIEGAGIHVTFAEQTINIPTQGFDHFA